MGDSREGVQRRKEGREKNVCVAHGGGGVGGWLAQT